MMLSANSAGSPLWYATRSTGVMAFLLLTAALVLGIMSNRRAVASRGWPRFATQAMHRNISLLASVFLLVHIVTTVLDSYVSVSWWSAVIPLTADYRRFAVTLGTLACDLVILLIATSLVRTRLPQRSWKVIHLSSYALWPLAFGHFVLTGTDSRHVGWGFYVALAGLAVVAGASCFRVLAAPGRAGPVRSLQPVRR